MMTSPLKVLAQTFQESCDGVLGYNNFSKQIFDGSAYTIIEVGFDDNLSQLRQPNLGTNIPQGGGTFSDGCPVQPNMAIEVCITQACPSGNCILDLPRLYFKHGSINSIFLTLEGTNYITPDFGSSSQTNSSEFDVELEELISDFGLNPSCHADPSIAKNCFFIPYYFEVFQGFGEMDIFFYWDNDTQSSYSNFIGNRVPIVSKELIANISNSINGQVIPSQQTACNIGIDFTQEGIIQYIVSSNSNYIIDQDYCFDFVANAQGKPGALKFEPGANIIVPSGRKLTISNCYIGSCKSSIVNNLIYVENGGKLVIEDSWIQDSKDAIIAEDGAEIIINGAEIRNNETGITFINSNSTGQADVDIANSKFYINGNSKVGSNEFIGVKSDAVSLGTGIFGTEFEHLNTGIELKNIASASVDESTFKNSDNGLVLDNNSNTAIGNSDFIQLTNGIIAKDNCDINVESSTFVNMTQAIEATQESYVRVNSSEFDNVSGIPSTAINAKRGAVHVGNTSRLSFKGLGGTTASDPTFVGCPFPFTGWGLSSMQVSETRIPSSKVALGNYVGSNVFVTDCHFTSDETTIDLALAISNFNVFDNNTLISNGETTDAVIKSQNLSQPLSFISNNTIQASNDCGDGLLMVNADPLYLTENVFDLSTDGFDEASGADLQFVTGNVRCNNFTGKGNGNNIQDGIEASTVTGTIRCNVFENNDYGYQTLVTGGINMVANEFKDQYIGLYLEKGTEISTQNHRGNTWTGSFDVDGAQNLNTDPTITDNSKFIVDDNNPVDGLPTFYTPSGADWFEDFQFSGTIPTCPSDCAPELADPDEILGDIEEKIGFWLDYVQPAQGHPYYDAELFNQRSDLYSRLKQVDSIPAVLSSFYSSYVSTDEAQLVDLIDDMAVLFQPNGLVDLNNAILADSLLLRNYLDSAIQTPIVLDTQAISQWQQDLNAVATTSNAASNVKDMLEMQAIKVLDPLYEYDTQEWNNITTLASSCPSTEGYGVYLARAIIMSLSNIKYDDVSLCATANQSRSIQQQVDEKTEQLLVAPNPGLNHIRIAVPDELKGETLKVFNIHGKLMREIDINSTTLNLDISNYQAGNYILQSGRFVERFIKVSE